MRGADSQKIELRAVPAGKAKEGATTPESTVSARLIIPSPAPRKVEVASAVQRCSRVVMRRRRLFLHRNNSGGVEEL